MNTKKRWIITVIVVFALAAVIVTGIVLNHSADRVLKATDGTEAVADGTEPAEEIPAEAPAEDTLELVLPGGDNTTEISSPEQAVPENAEQVIPENAQQAADTAESSYLPEELITDTANEPGEQAAENGTLDGADAENSAVQENSSENASSAEQPERVLITSDGQFSVEELNRKTSEGTASGSLEEPDKAKEEEETKEQEDGETEETGEKELHVTAADGARITVRKLDGTFPAGAYVKVFLVSADSAQSAVEEALEDDAQLVDLIAYDITIYDKEGKEIVPDETVEVSIVGASLEHGDGASVYHIEDNGSAKKVTDVEDSAQASFKPAEAG